MVSRGSGPEVSNPGKLCEAFISARVGLEVLEYHENLQKLLDDNKFCDFVITPIGSPRSLFYDSDKDMELIPDLVLPIHCWESSVAISIPILPLDTGDQMAINKFDRIFRHALYLPTPVVVIDCPNTSEAQSVVASVINKRLNPLASRPAVVIRMSLKTCRLPKTSTRQSSCHRSSTNSNQQNDSAKTQNVDDYSDESGIENGHSPERKQPSRPINTCWRVWNNFRSLLRPDPKIGVCLEMNDEIQVGEDLSQWDGEPVRMVMINCDQFTSTKAVKESTRLVGRLKEALRSVLIPNSFMTSFVLQAPEGEDTSEHISHLKALRDNYELQHQDGYRAWNDCVLIPLQPLSMNLDSHTYQIFELDETKYINYQQAMVEALDAVLMRKKSSYGPIIVMVLGAGRGPLVDAMISAITSLKSNQAFKIYALDKNHSSVRALKYKQRNVWSKAPSSIQVDVIEGDMRLWEPEEKADIIATELLGSFSDNELSPECIDGVYRFSTENTISIPQSYTSHIAPISSYRMYQQMKDIRTSTNNTFDQIYVVRLANYYMISDTKELFTFEHRNLSIRRQEGENQRRSTLTFTATCDTLCHGFAGYFSANLFGSTNISTVPSEKTRHMESWFPVFIPIEEPILLKPGNNLEVTFWRKESNTEVWYEWQITQPITTRIYSPGGKCTAMSKLLE